MAKSRTKKRTSSYPIKYYGDRKTQTLIPRGHQRGRPYIHRSCMRGRPRILRDYIIGYGAIQEVGDTHGMYFLAYARLLTDVYRSTYCN